jgi:hypothetical protein
MSANLSSLLLILNLLTGTIFSLTRKLLPRSLTELFIIPICLTSPAEIQDGSPTPSATNLLKVRNALVNLPVFGATKIYLYLLHFFIDKNNDYANSQIHAWLNNVTNGYLSTIAQNIRDQIKTVRIPYRAGANPSTTVSSGASGLSCRAFLLSVYEVGYDSTSNSSIPVEGVKLDYFIAGNAENAKTRRTANRAGSTAFWWLRSPAGNSADSAWLIAAEGHLGGYITSYTGYGPRPALVLPSSLLVSDDGTVLTNTPPTQPGSITVPGTILGGSSPAISWAASTDPQSLTVSYRLERSVNSGAWTQIFQGTGRSFSDTVAFGTTTVQYRVRAFNTLGLESANRTSSQISVNNNPPVISGTNSDLGVKTGVFSQDYTVTAPDAGDTLTVTESINGVQLRQYTATSGAQQTFTVSQDRFRRLPNGANTLTVTAAHQRGASATRTWTFSRNETQIQVQLESPLAADDMPSRIVVNVQRSIPPGASFQVLVCNNGNDASPAWEDCTNQVLNGLLYIFKNTTKTAAKWGVNIQVNVQRNGAVGDCWVSSIGGNFD